MPSNKPFLPDTKAIARRLGRSRRGATSRVDPFNPKGKGSRYRNESSIEDTRDNPMNDVAINRERRQAQEGQQTSRVTGRGNDSRSDTPDRSVGYTGPHQIPTSRTQGSVAASSEYGRRAGGSARSVKDKISKGAISRRLNAR